MEPTQDVRVTLVDVLDRVLDKGLVIQADVIISVAGIPLIGVNLRAALAGMETMLQYGMLKAWDEQIRGWERTHQARHDLRLLEGEAVLLRAFGSYYHARGIYTAWRSGSMYLTNRRLLLWNRADNETIFEAPLERIKALGLRREQTLTRQEPEELVLLLSTNQVARIRTAQPHQLKAVLEERICLAGLPLEAEAVVPQENGAAAKFLRPDEVVGCRGKIWHWLNHRSPGRKSTHTWRPGFLYLTNQRLLWWSEFDQRIGFEIPLRQLVATTVETRGSQAFLKEAEQVLDLIHQVGQDRRVSSFSGREAFEWGQALNRLIAQRGLLAKETEACPQCGRPGPAKSLLDQGCASCGWVSQRLKVKLAQAV